MNGDTRRGQASGTGRALAAGLLFAAACTTSVEAEGPYACGGGASCPGGSVCVAGRCEATGDSVDGAGGNADGAVACAGSLGPELQCFESFSTPLNRAQAQRTCETRGGHLATITTQAEHVAFLDALTFGAGWIGMTVDGTEGIWDTGEPVTFEWWIRGEPDGTGSCVQATFVGWRDNGCNDRSPYVCERPAR